MTTGLELTPLRTAPPAALPVEPAPVTVGHVVDFYRRYPGEPVTLFTRVDALADLPGVTLQVHVPAELCLGDATGPGGPTDTPELIVAAGERFLRWTISRQVQTGERFDFQIRADIDHVDQPKTIASEATAITRNGSDQATFTSETVSIAVEAKGRYLKYLPAIYSDDEVMGRFLMLFESLWGPIEEQIGTLPIYFDPRFTPADLLPWLATWVDLMLDERWPDEKRRQLLRSAVSLYRKRGTRRGLEEYLAIYTGAKIKITEHGARNFLLGPGSRLGPGIALGTLNRPHTFTVTVFLPAEDGPSDPDERARYEAERKRMIESIIEAEKPAHTSYRLRLEIVTRDQQ